MKQIIREMLRPIFPQVIVNYLYHLPKAFLASRLYGNPAENLEIIAVTGTDGKTTTTSLIYHILKLAKKKVAMISTVEAKVGRKSINTGFHVTAPDPFQLQKLLRRFRSQKIRYCVLEVTSHGIDQFRFYPIKPEIAVLTNITHEHLDYHHTFENYMETKLRLFKGAAHAVVNKDLAIFAKINASLPKVLFSTYSIDTDSQLRPENVTYNSNGTNFRLGRTVYFVPLTGRYNLYNTLAAVSTALLLGVAPSDIKRALATFPGVKGRFEEITNSRKLHVIVDFAHTPNALREVLMNVRSQANPDNRVIAVFGSAGLRDASKRPLMGAEAGSLADKIILTSEDPRTEKASDIAEQIISGMTEEDKKKVRIILDREKAINFAINKTAKTGDWVVVCGKGHEESMNMNGTTETPWSDQGIASRALKDKL